LNKLGDPSFCWEIGGHKIFFNKFPLQNRVKGNVTSYLVKGSGTQVASQKRRERPGGQVYNYGGRDSVVV
jgi:hypothetical protein